jgi:hypothetical protein
MGTLNVDAINNASGSLTDLNVSTQIGIWQFISITAITTVANISVTSLAAGYDYFFQLEAFCPTTDANQLAVRVSVNNGSAYLAGGSDYKWGAGNQYDAADTEISIDIGTSGTLGNDSGNANNASFTLINPGGTDEGACLYGLGAYQSSDSTPGVYGTNFGGQYIGATTAVNAIQFGWTTSYGSNTFKAQGDIAVWRRRRS